MATVTDDAIIREVEEKLHVDIIPGTEIMAQVAGVAHLVDNGRVVLVPQPNNSPDDPLNWNRRWKFVIMAQAILLSFVQSLGPLSIAPQVPFYIEEWHKDLASVLRFTGVCILVLGFSNFLWVPIATTFGRRPAVILSTLLSLGACFWRATATSYESFLGAASLHGVGAGTVETLPPVLIADVMFLHERGLWMNVYTWSYFGSLMVGPIISGAMSQQHGWRSFWWLNVALYAVVLVFQVVLLPETYYDRSKPVAETATISSAENGTEEKNNSLEGHEVVVRAADHVDEYLGKGVPVRKQFFEFHVLSSWNECLLSLYIPFKLFLFPIVEWSSFVFSWSASCFLMVNLTQSQVLAAPPYNFSASAVGYTNFPPLVGATFGMLTAGPFSDWISMKATIRNNGIREPEMRLPSLIPYLICCIAGALVTAYGYQNTWRWEVIVIIGYTLLGIQVSAIPAIASTYSIDSYKPVTGEILVSTTVNKNLWGYGLSAFITPWILKNGYVDPLMTNMGLTVMFTLMAVPLYFWGKSLRHLTKDSFVHRR